MTTVHIRRSRETITGVEVSGHSGYAEYGSDIVCAAITSAVRLLECALGGELGLDTRARAENGAVSLSPVGAEDKTAQVILSAFRAHMIDLSKEYPENIRVMEEA